MSTVDILFEDARWRSAGLEALATRAVSGTLAHFGLDPEGAEVSLLACDDARISVLNADFRGKSSPTNVLSWPSEDLSAQDAGAMPGPLEPSPDGTLELGDIAIAWETCRREADSQGKAFDDHVSHLIVHAMLHLLGFDHVREADGDLMEATEIEILGKMGLDDPYI